MATKPITTYSDDRNWHWPEETWFRQRLSAVKAQAYEQRRKALSSVKPAPVSAKSKTTSEPLKVE